MHAATGWRANGGGMQPPLQTRVTRVCAGKQVPLATAVCWSRQSEEPANDWRHAPAESRAEAAPAVQRSRSAVGTAGPPTSCAQSKRVFVRISQQASASALQPSRRPVTLRAKLCRKTSATQQSRAKTAGRFGAFHTRSLGGLKGALKARNVHSPWRSTLITPPARPFSQGTRTGFPGCPFTAEWDPSDQGDRYCACSHPDQAHPAGERHACRHGVGRQRRRDATANVQMDTGVCWQAVKCLATSVG